MGAKIVKSENLCCQLVVFTRLSLLMLWNTKWWIAMLDVPSTQIIPTMITNPSQLMKIHPIYQGLNLLITLTTKSHFDWK